MLPLRIFAFASNTTGAGLPDEARRRPVIIANPPGDNQFRELIDRALLAGAGGPQDLEATLRSRYPAAVVRRRELAGENLEVWYAYRDGHWIRSDDDAET